MASGASAHTATTPDTDTSGDPPLTRMTPADGGGGATQNRTQVARPSVNKPTFKSRVRGDDSAEGRLPAPHHVANPVESILPRGHLKIPKIDLKI